MFPERNPVHTVGSYTVHRGRLSAEDARGAQGGCWIEGPTLTGRMAPLASCWNEGDAIRRANAMAERDEREAIEKTVVL